MLAVLANAIAFPLAKEYNVMHGDSNLMSTREAAAYLGMPVATLKWHVVKGHITPRKIGRTLIFTRAQLDAFRSTPRPKPGRPPKD